MVVWKAKIMASEKMAKIEIKISNLLKDGWKIKGYSVDNKFHYALLVKEYQDTDLIS